MEDPKIEVTISKDGERCIIAHFSTEFAKTITNINYLKTNSGNQTMGRRVFTFPTSSTTRD